MNALKKYQTNSSRCDSIIDLFKTLNGNPKGFSKGGFNYKDLLRAVTVLKVAAMDNYFTSKFMDMLIPYIRKEGVSDDLAILIQESGLSYKKAINLVNEKKPFQKLQRVVENKISRFVTQNVEKIDNLFLCFGIKDLSENAEKLSGNNRLLDNIQEIVNRRHLIVHEGDLNKNGTIKDFRINSFFNKFRDIDQYVLACEKILNNRIAKMK